ncbi:glycosyltransferase family 32 protein [Cystobasidium minutum MCA 4210]|uniref:glycosyltransferase family 32 protein n=1 Tax=Cystobasidium minutum MCA 4210 TaxID=1397322 RepID=UPI0034CF1ECF|eukprot:jgi/Rhomi1/198848/gm1.7062_g
MPRPRAHSSGGGGGGVLLSSRRSNSYSPRYMTTSINKKQSPSSCTNLYTWLLSFLAAFLLGTVIVLSVVKSFFGVDWNDAIDTHEIKYYESLHTLPYGSDDLPSSSNTSNTIIEKVPRIIHQTWKSSSLPSKWNTLSKTCQSMHKDFEYKLWTDESSLAFIKEHYPWFLPTYLGYQFNIQRADAIRYFVLHKYGGVYLDLDVATKPIGVSNDVMFSEPNSKFMDSVIHNLLAFDHYVISDYPTVMFSTGPMFLSAVLSLWNSKSSYGEVADTIVAANDAVGITNSSSPLSNLVSRSPSIIPEKYHNIAHTVRILPKELYGKNADPDLVPDSFFYHYYGSSWHQNDSAIFTFLGNFGKQLMNLAFIVVFLGTAFIVVKRVRRRRRSTNKNGYGLLQSSVGSNSTRMALGYDSDVEDGNGRATPPLLPPSSRSAPSSSRRRRRQHRRAITAGARSWLCGKRSISLSLAGDASSSSYGGDISGHHAAGRRRSASTGGAGAISLPLHSSESDDAQFYTSSSEDGRESRRDSIFGSSVEGGGRAGIRRASIWMGGIDGEDEAGDDDKTIVSSRRTVLAPLLHRRASSQPGVDGSSPPSTGKLAAADGSRTPRPPNYLELPPPPPYRPPSPYSPITPSSLLPVPLSPSQRTWLSSFFSSVVGPRSPSSPTSASSSSQLPFSSSSNSNSNSNDRHHSRSNSNNSQIQSSAISSSSISSSSDTGHARAATVPSRSCSPSNLTLAHSRQQSESVNGVEIFNTQYVDERSPGRRSESMDDDAFSLHSVKARR